MRKIGKLKNIIDAITGKPIGPRDDNSQPFFDSLISYTSNDPNSFVGISALHNANVFATVNRIAKDLSSNPINYSDSSAQGRRIQNLIAREPNPQMNSFSFIYALSLEALINGNSFAEIARNNSGQVSALNFLDDAQMTVTKNDQTGRLTYTYQGRKIKQEDILHIKFFTNDGLTGYSPLLALNSQIAVEEGKDQLLKNYMRHGILGNIALTYTGTDASPQNLRNMRQNWEDVNRNTLSGVVAVPKDVKLDQLNFDSSVLDIANKTTATAREIAAVYGVPPEVINIENEHSNSSMSMSYYLQFTLTSYFRALVSELDKKLATQGNSFSYDTSALFTADPAQNEQRLIADIQGGLLTVNEARKQLNLPPVDGGDQLANLNSRNEVENNEQQ